MRFAIFENEICSELLIKIYVDLSLNSVDT